MIEGEMQVSKVHEGGEHQAGVAFLPWGVTPIVIG
jgi:hypothetical protein